MGAFFHEYGGQLVSKTIEHFYFYYCVTHRNCCSSTYRHLVIKTTRTANVVLTIAGASNDSYARSVSYYDSDFR